MARDRIDAAVAAAAAAEQPEPEKRAQIPVTITSTGRKVFVDVPADMTDAEIVEWTGWFLTAAYNAIKQAREQAKGPQLLVPQKGILLPGAN